MPRLSITDVAARVGVHKSTVSRQARQWGLVGEDGRVELHEYVARRAGGIDPGLQTTGGSAVQAPTLGTAERPDIAEERAKKLAADREKAEIELAARKGELVRLDQVAAEQEAIFRALRDELMGLPRELAEQLVGVEVPAVIEARLRRALNSKLRLFAEALEAEEPDAAGRSAERSAPGAQIGGAGASPAA